MKRTLIALLLVASACVGGGSNERTILVDYSSDEFPSFALFNFPQRVEVHPGDTLVIRQTWTGEPHTFTGGTLINDGLASAQGWIDFFDGFTALAQSGVPLPNPEDPGDATFTDFAKALTEAKPSADKTKAIKAWNSLRAQGVKLPALDSRPEMSFAELAQLVDEESNKAMGGLPEALGDDDVVAQNAAQPCYLRRGSPPKSPDKPCAKAQQKQPAFDGKQSFYNSGIIPYQGPQGNTYRVPLSDNIKPGSYLFFCEVHGPQQRTEVVVRPASAKISSQDQVTREAQKEINEIVDPLRKQYRDARDGKFAVPGENGTTIEGPFAGLIGGDHTAVNVFLPKRLTARVNQPITWKMMGADHTITFNPPKYFPPLQFLEDGTVRFNPKLRPPAGGAKKVPHEESEGPVKVDGGTFSGRGFWSTGLIGAQPYLEYTVRIARPGTYRYACLIHPPMVGTVVVTS